MHNLSILSFTQKLRQRKAAGAAQRMSAKTVFISNRLKEFYKIVRSDLSYEFGIDMYTHAEANSRYVYRAYYDLFVVDLDEPWLALPLWVKEQAQHQYFHQFIFISDKAVNGSLGDLLGVRLYKVINFKTAENDLAEILRDAAEAAKSHKYNPVNISRSYEENFEGLLGSHPSVLQVKEFIKLVSKARFAPCLIHGETGTGRKLCGQMVHRANDLRDDLLFIKDCDNHTTNELLGDLFGVHETGVYGPKHKGLLETYAGGTVILENIEKLPLDVQDKLLFYLEDRLFKPLGSNIPVEANTRIIGITRYSLDWYVKNRNFNPDLFFHLNAFEVNLPPLRDRGNDLLLLIQYYLQFYNNFYGKSIKSFSAGALRILREYCWPGNIQELKEVVELAVYTGSAAQLKSEDLQDFIKQKKDDTGPDENQLGDCSLKDMERLHIQKVLLNTSGNKSKAAAILEISRTTLREKIRQYNLAD